jgi:hypothetical protein
MNSSYKFYDEFDSNKLINIIHEDKNSDQNINFGLIVFENPFKTISHDFIAHTMKEFAVPIEIQNYVNSFYASVLIKHENKEIRMNKGLITNDRLSEILIIMCIYKIIINILMDKKIPLGDKTIIPIIHPSKIYVLIKSKEELEHVITSIIFNVNNFGNSYGLNINKDECLIKNNFFHDNVLSFCSSEFKIYTNETYKNKIIEVFDKVEKKMIESNLLFVVPNEIEKFGDEIKNHSARSELINCIFSYLINKIRYAQLISSKFDQIISDTINFYRFRWRVTSLYTDLEYSDNLSIDDTIDFMLNCHFTEYIESIDKEFALIDHKKYIV